MEQTISKRIWHILQAVYYMLRKGISKKKLMMDIHLMLKRGKLAGKSLAHFLTPHPHASASSFSCLSADPNLSFFNPTEVEFSCSNTPAASANYPAFHLLKRGKKSHKHPERHVHDAEYIAKVFEILNTGTEAGGENDTAAYATPSPMLALALGKSPAVARQLRVTDSPFQEQEEGTPSNGIVDQQADAFIRSFYQQLRLQATPTPEHNARRGG